MLVRCSILSVCRDVMLARCSILSVCRDVMLARCSILSVCRDVMLARCSILSVCRDVMLARCSILSVCRDVMLARCSMLSVGAKVWDSQCDVISRQLPGTHFLVPLDTWKWARSFTRYFRTRAHVCFHCAGVSLEAADFISLISCDRGVVAPFSDYKVQ